MIPVSSDGNDRVEEAIARLSQGLGLPALRSTARQAILMSLAINRKMKFTDLVKLTGSGKGSLWNHIGQMEQAGLIKKSKVSFFSSPKIYVEITSYGRSVYGELLAVISEILGDKLPEIDEGPGSSDSGKGDNASAGYQQSP